MHFVRKYEVKIVDNFLKIVIILTKMRKSINNFPIKCYNKRWVFIL